MCLTPLNLPDANKVFHAVPCSKCPECKARRASAWSFRLMQEEKISISAHFITLTYDTLHVPVTKKRYMGLDKRDLQLFFKRLRKAQGKGGSNGRAIKYYAVGEYGGRTKRPHYHIILFNADIQLIQPAWNKGEVHYGTVTGASVGYTLKYISKPKTIPQHANDDRLSEFSLMSKRLGANYLTKQMVAYHKKDLQNRVCLTTEQGQKISMPRYYKDKIFNSEERGYIKGYFEQLMEIDGIKAIHDPNFKVNERNHLEAIRAAFRNQKNQCYDKEKI